MIEPKITIPQRLRIKFTIDIDVTNIPPEKQEAFNRKDLKTWAQEFKADMEGDPDFGPHTKVDIDIEEVI